MTNDNIYAKRRADWKNDLRSGKYTQGVELLCRYVPDPHSDIEDEYFFCCLGVACQRFMDNEKAGKWTGDGEHTQFVIPQTLAKPEEEISQYHIMPPVVFEWYGLHELEQPFRSAAVKYDFRIPHPRENRVTPYIQNFLYLCNDDIEMSFKEIAEVIGWIEDPVTHWKKLHATTVKIKKANGIRIQEEAQNE